MEQWLKIKMNQLGMIRVNVVFSSHTLLLIGTRCIGFSVQVVSGGKPGATEAVDTARVSLPTPG